MNTDTEKDDLILEFDPFEGDFGGQDDRVFRNQMVVARKEGPCAHCGTLIKKGERVRSQQSKFDGQLMSHRWCAACCDAMATYYPADDDEEGEIGVEYEARSQRANRMTS
jgi:predicted nucleic acid-binding Zn ribbon protein